MTRPGEDRRGRLRGRHVVYTLALVSLGVTVVWALGAGWAPERELRLARGSGWVALASLLSAIVTSPLGRLAGHVLRRPLAGPTTEVRRALGIASAAAASLHASVSVAGYLRGSLADLLEIAWLRGGVVALAILLPLWLTSFPTLVKRLRVRLWKPLHRLAYLAVLLVAQHTLLSPFGPRGILLGAFGLAALVSCLRLLPSPRGVRLHD